jgi:hypothetical protein
MSTDLQTLSTAIAELASLQSKVLESFKTLADSVDSLQQQQQKVVASNSNELAPFSAFLMVELTPYFGGSGAKMIVDKLNRSRAIGDFRYFSPIYKIADGDLKKRQLLKVVSAVYRYKFSQLWNPDRYALRSEIKYAKACPDCGEFAQILVNRLIAEGLWK